MAKFSNAEVKTKAAKGPAKARRPASTHEGGEGWAKSDKTALYTLAVTDMINEPTYYESGGKRKARLVSLVHKVAAKDPEWIEGFIPFLRNTAQMRSSSIVVAAEFAHALLELRRKGNDSSEVNVRSVISSACSRADEPAEMLGYWLSTYGRSVPAGVKRGIADAAVRLYDEYAAIKYDGNSRGVRLADVIDLTHPTPGAEWQSALFRHLLDKRHGHFDASERAALQVAGLEKITRAYELDSLPEDQRRAVLENPSTLLDAGYTWERLSGWLPGGMDAQAWGAMIESGALGYMAKLRNLRNFEEAGVSKSLIKRVARELADPEAVDRSRQFPYRFWSAYRHSGSVAFAGALEEALERSVKNIPKFSGRTLVAIDTSGSMRSPISARSAVQMYEVGALFGCAVGAGSNVDVIQYADRWASVKMLPSVLRSVEEVAHCIGSVGYGTHTWPSVVAAYWKHGPYDRVVVFTDMQDHPGHVSSNSIPAEVPIYVWDLRGYRAANINTDKPGRYLFSGFTDAAFRMIPLLEAGRDQRWPWLEDED